MGPTLPKERIGTMAKFDGMLMCCDIDGTLINDDMAIPKNNLDAIEYFRGEGGLFTVATGRTIFGARMYFDIILPDTPIVCQNGGAIYDGMKKEYLWYSLLPRSSRAVVEYVENKFPFAGIEILTCDKVYFCRENHYTYLHKTQEFFEPTVKNWREINEPWIKVLFAQSPRETDILQADMEKQPFYSDFRIMRSAPTYYEFIEKNSDKGFAVKKLLKILGENLTVITVGDNDNDDTMLSMSDRSFVPSCASEKAKKCAKTVLKSSNNDGVLEEVIGLL